MDITKNQANNIFKIKITYQLLILNLYLNLCETVIISELLELVKVQINWLEHSN